MGTWFRETTLDGQGLSIEVSEVLYEGRSAFQHLAVYATPAFGNVLALDGLVQTTERDEFTYHEMLAHVPLMAHPAPRRVLVVGGGDGGTVREVLKHPDVVQVDLCEIDGEVISLARRFFPGLAGALDDARVRIHVADALAFVRGAQAEWDVVLVDSSDPVGPGEGLFTTAFYRDVRGALRQGGVVCAQTESPWAMPDGFQRALRALAGAFPRVHPYVGIVPTYPGGLWSWTFASAEVAPRLCRPDAAHALSPRTRHYNAAVHAAAFALPTYVRLAAEEALST